MKMARICRNDVPHVLREFALILAMRGCLGRARWMFDRSLAMAEDWDFFGSLLSSARAAR